MTTLLVEGELRSTLRVEGNIHIADAAALKAALSAAIALRRDVSLQLDGMTGLGVTALQLLIAAERETRASGFSLQVEGELPANTLRLMAAVGFKDFPGRRSGE